MNPTETKAWKIIGINDDETICALCGKENLKRVIWIENEETGEVMAVGTTCISKMLGITTKEQKKREKLFAKIAKAKIEKELNAFSASLPLVPQSFWYDRNEAYREMDSMKLTLSERMAFIASDERILALGREQSKRQEAYIAKEKELQKKYGLI